MFCKLPAMQISIRLIMMSSISKNILYQEVTVPSLMLLTKCALFIRLLTRYMSTRSLSYFSSTWSIDIVHVLYWILSIVIVKQWSSKSYEGVTIWTVRNNFLKLCSNLCLYSNLFINLFLLFTLLPEDNKHTIFNYWYNLILIWRSLWAL